VPAFALGDDVEHPPFPVAGKVQSLSSVRDRSQLLSGLIAGQVASHVIRKKLDGGNVHVKSEAVQTAPTCLQARSKRSTSSSIEFQ